MRVEIGMVSELVRYPVKSMAGTTTESASIGWHGLDGDRRFALRRLGNNSGFPWLTASRCPELLLYTPIYKEENKTGEASPTHILTPDGHQFEMLSSELAQEIKKQSGMEVELMKLKHGIFDEAPISVISLATIAGIGKEVGEHLDRRRFRANIVVETNDTIPFLEDEWVGGMLVFGNSDPQPAVQITLRDERCVMINLDPDTATQDPRVLKAAVRLNNNNAGVYGTVVQRGLIQVGDPVFLRKS